MSEIFTDESLPKLPNTDRDIYLLTQRNKVLENQVDTLLQVNKRCEAVNTRLSQLCALLLAGMGIYFILR